MTKWVRAVLPLAALAFAASLEAAPITLNVSGTITAPDHLFGSPIATGDRFTAELVYESLTPLTISSGGGEVDEYLHAVLSLSFTFHTAGGPVVYAGAPNAVGRALVTRDYVGFQMYDVISGPSVEGFLFDNQPATFRPTGLNLIFYGNFADALRSDRLPAEVIQPTFPFPLAYPVEAGVSLHASADGVTRSAVYQGFQSQTASVPEPGTLLLSFLGALTGLAMSRRRRR